MNEIKGFTRPEPKERYHVDQEWWGWVVRCGNGTQILYSSLFYSRALNFAQRLTTAFNDGQFFFGAANCKDDRLQRIAELIGGIIVYSGFVPETEAALELVALLKETGNFWETVEEYEADYILRNSDKA